MSTPQSKTPAELMGDLTDQVRLLRQDVVNLTATAVTQAEAKKLMSDVRGAASQAFEQGRTATLNAERIAGQMKREGSEAARGAAEWAVKGLKDEVALASSLMRAEALKSRKEALFYSGGALAVCGGLLAIGAILGALAFFWMQGRADARAFGRHPGIFCSSAGGTVSATDSGRKFCAFWIDPQPKR